VAADPDKRAPLPGAGVQSHSALASDVTQAQPIIPAAVRPPRPAPAQGPVPVSHFGVQSPQAAPGSVPFPGAVPAPASQAPVIRPAAPRHALPQAGDVLAGRYRVEKLLGQGSLSNAYLCRDPQHGNREVVIKAMHARKAAEPGLAESFLFLADSVAKYDAKGVAKVFESGRMGQAGEVPYYAMEWVSGVPLRMWLMERLTFENRVLPGLGIVRSLLDTFEAIHERGCYGCLKPENVFVGLSGPVVMDFGVAGFLTPQEFEFNSYARRYLPYMAPELRQDWSNLVPHSDYYSLGAILYEILSGRPPTSPLRLPSELSDLFGIEADEIILKAMAPKPLDRFGTLEAFRSAVESLQAVLLGAGPRQPGSEGSRSMQVASSASMVHNPDETFESPSGTVPILDPAMAGHPAFPQGAVPGPADSMDGNDWAHEPDARDAESPAGGYSFAAEEAAAPEAGASSGGGVRSAFTDPESRQGEAAHALRRFTHSPRGAFPEGGLPAPGAESGESQVLSGAWDDNAPGQPVPAVGPDGEPVEEEEPVPAWLWISIALAGCSFVVLSAYLGLLLPR